MSELRLCHRIRRRLAEATSSLESVACETGGFLEEREFLDVEQIKRDLTAACNVLHMAIEQCNNALAGRPKRTADDSDMDTPWTINGEGKGGAE